MTAAELLIKIRDALVADRDLALWCYDTYGKRPDVWLDMDERNPPKSGDYPLIAILGISQVRGDDKREIAWEVWLGVAIEQNTVLIEEVADVLSIELGITHTITYTGMYEIETFRELCEDALYRARIAAADSDSESVPLNDYPLFSSLTTFTVKTLRSTRRALPAR